MSAKDRPLAKTTVVIFPFDLFGSAGTGAGAALVGDELREILADNRREQTPTRARAYQGQVQLRELTFETLPAYQDWRKKARLLVRQVLGRDEFLFWMAGNHLGVLPVYEELGTDTLVVQLDAHLDVHQFTDSTKELSHGNFLRHAEVPLPAIINVGHRELLLCSEDVRDFYEQTHSAEALAIDAPGVLRQLRQSANRAGKVFLDIDWDVMDPGFFPAVTTPMPFGLGPQQLLQVLEAVWSERVIGLAMSEFDPGHDRNDQGLSMLLWLLEHVLLKRYENRAKRGHKK